MRSPVWIAAARFRAGARPRVGARAGIRAAIAAFMALNVTVMGLVSTAMAKDSGDAALSPQDFAYYIPILSVGDAGAYRFSVPLAVYQKTVRTDLGDIRVFNGKGEVVPYAIERPVTGTVTHAAEPLPVFPLKDDSNATLDAIRVTIESGRASVDVQGGRARVETATSATSTAGGITSGENAGTGGKSGAEGGRPNVASGVTQYVVDGRALNVPLAALLLEWPADASDFAGRLKVEASETLGDWRVVSSSAAVANLRAGGERLIERRVELPPTQSKFWRLSWIGTPAPFVLAGVLGEPAGERVDMERANLFLPGHAAKAKDGGFEFDLGAHPPVDRLNVELPEPNTVVEIEVLSRAQPTDHWRPVLRSGFYRVKSNGVELRNASSPIDVNFDRYWLVRPDSRVGGLGSGVPRLIAGWVSHRVVFLARGSGPFIVAYGSSAARPADVPLASIPKNVTIADAMLGSPQKAGGDDRLLPLAAGLPWKTWFLWGVLVAGAAVLAWMAYRLSKDFR